MPLTPYRAYNPGRCGCPVTEVRRVLRSRERSRLRPGSTRPWKKWMHGPAASTSVGKRGLPVLHQASRKTGHAAIAGEQPSASKNRGWVRRRRRSRTGRSANTVVVRPGWPDRRMKRSENGFVILSAGHPPAPQTSRRRARKTRFEQWAQQERQRRQAWVAGPTDEEKRLWARRETPRFGPAVSTVEPDVRDMADCWIRDADLCGEGHAPCAVAFSVCALVVPGPRWPRV